MRARWLARLLLPPARRLAARRPPDFVVQREEGAVYLIRWWILPRNDWLNLYLHQMLRDDDAVLHDHPYASVSLVLTDGLTERYAEEPEDEEYYQSVGDHVGAVRFVRVLRQGDVVRRSSRLAHQLLVRGEAWTLFATGPRIREWGFWCPKGWKHNREFESDGGCE